MIPVEAKLMHLLLSLEFDKFFTIIFVTQSYKSNRETLGFGKKGREDVWQSEQISLFNCFFIYIKSKKFCHRQEFYGYSF